MAGPSAPLDRRIHAIRDDLADFALAGQVVAPRYASPVAMQCIAPVSRVFQAPNTIQVSELIAGEGFNVFDQAGDWSWGQGSSDGYVGWVRSIDLALPVGVSDCRVTAPQALAFAEPSIKSTVLATLPLGSVLSGSGDDTMFVRSRFGWIHRRHLAPLSGDIVDLAGSFIGTPYHWGGRTRDGIDCSGLVQAVLIAHDVACPRDSDQQRAAFAPVPPVDRQRGDLMFVPGHVGILVERDILLHANAYWMTTLAEPLDDVLARLPSRDFDVRRPLVAA